LKGTDLKLFNTFNQDLKKNLHKKMADTPGEKNTFSIFLKKTYCKQKFVSLSKKEIEGLSPKDLLGINALTTALQGTVKTIGELATTLGEVQIALEPEA
ncbi:MAG: hypothetical protein V1855_04605, partial [bacterium]